MGLEFMDVWRFWFRSFGLDGFGVSGLSLGELR